VIIEDDTVFSWQQSVQHCSHCYRTDFGVFLKKPPSRCVSTCREEICSRQQSKFDHNPGRVAACCHSQSANSGYVRRILRQTVRGMAFSVLANLRARLPNKPAWVYELSIRLGVAPELRTSRKLCTRTDSPRRGPEVWFWSITLLVRSGSGKCPRSRFRANVTSECSADHCVRFR